MFDQQFCLAAVGMIKANLISRELGLANGAKSVEPKTSPRSV